MKKKNLLKFVNEINKKYPNRHFEPAVALGCRRRDFIKSGISQIDKITGGGYPKGKLTLISGLPNSGKTYLALRAAAAANKRGGYVAWIDNDRSFELSRAIEAGVDPERFYLVHSQDTATSLDIALTLALSGEFELIVFDTLTSLVPHSDSCSDVMEPIFYETINNLYYESSFERFFAIISALGQSVIATTITYENPNVIYGNPETIEGGRSLMFYAGLWLDLRNPLIIKGDPSKNTFALTLDPERFSVEGLYIEVKCLKNKYSPPFMVCHFTIPFTKKRKFKPYIRAKTNKNGIATECAHIKPSGICLYCDDSLGRYFGSSCVRCPFFSTEVNLNENILVNELSPI